MNRTMAGTAGALEQETLPPLQDGRAPQTLEDLWAGFDPRAEPLDVEVLQEWEEDGVVLKVLRYRMGVFKGQKAMMAAVYGYPKNGSNLPGLVQIHGGGQYANYQAPLANGKRGYATISISWGGRIAAPDYQVTPEETKLFWDGKTGDPKYKRITDWGALDAYHAPNRNARNSNWENLSPAAWTLDDVESPRNSNWFLCALGARRALTFLERQPEVDADRLGVYGHSMGGKLTVMVAGSDPRVKAAAPSCGGVSHRVDNNPPLAATIGDDVYLERIACPIMFLSPSNDFHGRIDDLQTALEEIKTEDWRATCSAHHNHQDTPAYEVATPLWMDQCLKRTFRFPRTPDTELKLVSAGGIPSLTVRPDTAKPIVRVDVFYTQQGRAEDAGDDRENCMARFWHYAATVKQHDDWTAALPLHSVDKPLWIYANVVYSLEAPVSGAGYYYGLYTADTFNLSSRMHITSPGELKAAGVQTALRPARLIESFEGDWEKEWFTYRPEAWERSTHKVYHPLWAAPEGAKLSWDVRAAEVNTLVIMIDQYAAEVVLSGGLAWQSITLSAADFSDAAGEPLPGWAGIKELRLAATACLRKQSAEQTRPVGAPWTGSPPQFRNLRWAG